MRLAPHISVLITYCFYERLLSFEHLLYVNTPEHPREHPCSKWREHPLNTHPVNVTLENRICMEVKYMLSAIVIESGKAGFRDGHFILKAIFLRSVRQLIWAVDAPVEKEGRRLLQHSADRSKHFPSSLYQLIVHLESQCIRIAAFLGFVIEL